MDQKLDHRLERARASRPSSRCPAQDEPPPSGRASRCRRSTSAGWRNFKRNRRGYWSLWIFLVLFVLSLVRRVHRQRPADRRLLQGRDPVPGAGRLSRRRSSAASSPSPTTATRSSGTRSRPTAGCSGRRSATPTAPSTTRSPTPAPAPPWWMMTQEQRCSALSATASTTRTARIGNWNWLGTDDQAPRRAWRG